MSMLDDIRFWAQVLTDSRRTIVCSPENESRVKTYLDARGLDGVFAVEVSRVVPDDRLYVVDRNAIEASMEQVAQRAARHPFRWTWG